MMRPSWDEYYLGIAKAVSARGECKRRQVGAVIVKHHSIVGTGYNGAPPGKPSCLDGACPRADSDAPANVNYAESGCHVIHAETNALMRTHWLAMQDATMYITDEPCVDCWPKIQASGITRVIWPESKTFTSNEIFRPSYEQSIAIEAVLLQEYKEIPNATNTVNRLWLAVISPEEIIGTDLFERE